MKKVLILLLALISLLFTVGCGPWQVSENKQMTSGGAIGDNFTAWQNEDEYARADFKAQISRWWTGEKAKWPKFKDTGGVNAEECYINYEEELAASKKK